MKLSIFSDELGLDVRQALPEIRSWGFQFIDLRALLFGKALEQLLPAEMRDLRALLDRHGLRVAVLQSSLAKVHLPDHERQRQEARKLEAILRAAEVFDCRIVRSFHFWQPGRGELRGELTRRPDELQKVLDLVAPLAERAREAGLVLGFENCGVEPDEVFTLLDALGVPGWGLAWDPHNTWDCDERRKDESAFIRRLLVRANLIHVKGAGAVPELEAELIPYEKIVAAAHALGTIHAVSVETHALQDKVEISRKVSERIRRIWPSAAPGSLEDALAGRVTIKRRWADNPARFVVVGLGMGRNRARMIQGSSGCALLGVCDLVADRARKAAQELGVPWETDVRRWLERDEVEVVYVVTETGNHAKVAIQALEAGKHVISTKPMEADLAAADAMVAAARRAGRLLAVDFEARFHPEAVSLKDAIAKGFLGRPLFVNASLSIRRTAAYFAENGGWRGTRRLDGGGVLSNQAIHLIDELVYVFGVPQRVRALVRTQVHAIEAEDLGVATWEYGHGLVINLSATSTFPQHTWYPRIEAHGEEGAYARFSGGHHPDGKGRWFLKGKWTDLPPTDAQPLWMNSADNMAAALREQAPLVASGDDGRATQSVLEAMYGSALRGDGHWVGVPPPCALHNGLSS